MKRFVKTILATSLIALSSQTFAVTNNPSANVSPEERAKIESVVHDYLIQKPEVIVEVFQILQKKQMDQAQNVMKKTQADAGKYVDKLFRQKGDPAVGNANAKVTVVEFFDYQCPHCVDMAPVIADIIKSNSDDVRIVFKDFPIRGRLSEFAARAALAANLQGKYYEMNHALLTADQPLTEENVYVIAQKQGLDVEKLKKDINDKAVTDVLKANMNLGEADLKLFGTPAIFIGRTDATKDGVIKYFPGQMSKEQLQTEIDNLKK